MAAVSNGLEQAAHTEQRSRQVTEGDDAETLQDSSASAYGDTDVSGLPASFGETDSEANRTTSSSWGKFRGCRTALIIPPAERTSAEVDEIYEAVRTIQDPFFTRLEESVKKAVCERLDLQECKPGERIFDYGDEGDKLYLIWSGRVQIEVPRDKVEEGKPVGPMVKLANLDPGKAFGELALMSADSKRKGRITALKATELLTLTAHDYRWCVGFSQENFVRERVTFLKTAEGCVMEDSSEVDLQAMAGCLIEESYIGEKAILKQGEEVDKVIFVKSGFCKIVRQLHPKCKDRFYQWANDSEPMPNPYADGEEGLLVGQKGVWPDPSKRRRGPEKKTGEQSVTAKSLAAELGLGSRQALRKLLRKFPMPSEESGEDGSPTQGSYHTSPVAGAKRARMLTFDRVGAEADVLGDESSSESKEVVVVEIIGRGCSMGVMELMEGLTYQCSVIAAPCAEVYAITKFDFIRNVSKGITHRLFCNYKVQLPDKLLLHRLKQKNRWELYKRELLDEIRNWNSSMSKGIINREDPPPRSVGVSGGLPEEDTARIGKGQKLWDERAQTPPNQAYSSSDQVTQIFHVSCTHDAAGRPNVIVDREQRDASMDALEEKLLVTVATARYRDKLRRKPEGQGLADGSQLALPDAAQVPETPPGNTVLQTQELESAAKTAMKQHVKFQQDRIQALRREVKDKANQSGGSNEVSAGRPSTLQRKSRTTLPRNRGSQSARASTKVTPGEEAPSRVPALPPAEGRSRPGLLLPRASSIALKSARSRSSLD